MASPASDRSGNTEGLHHEQQQQSVNPTKCELEDDEGIGSDDVITSSSCSSNAADSDNDPKVSNTNLPTLITMNVPS